MKYYVVSDEELFELVLATVGNSTAQNAAAFNNTREKFQKRWEKAEAACRAREVTLKHGGSYANGVYALWEENSLIKGNTL